MHSMQRPLPDSPPDSIARKTGIEELADGDDAMLRPRDPRHDLVR
jgi:hypothetical protein